jgi:drug/metabolite transporter (DMT)-like permease
LYLLCSNRGSFSFGWGEALAVVVAICAAGALVWGEKSLQSLSPLTVSFAQITVTTVLSIAGALIFERDTDLSAIQPVAWWVIVYLAILCSCLSYLLQNTALVHIPSSLVSLTHCTEPVFTAAASFFFLGERLSGTGWWGAVLLLACIVYGNYI